MRPQRHSVNFKRFLPLLDSGIRGYSAEEMVADDCRYVMLPDGGWNWPLWKWKGPVITEGNCVYGKFFAGKAGFTHHSRTASWSRVLSMSSNARRILRTPLHPFQGTPPQRLRQADPEAYKMLMTGNKNEV